MARLASVEEVIAHISMKPWSDYSESDYTPQQWYDACLIHLGDSGPPYKKADCKLPVKTPDGAVNQNGVYAAAAALAGARGGVNAPPEKKAEAARALVKLYKQMDKEPPPSIMGMLSHSVIDDVLVHFGVKGMKWGVRHKPQKVGPSKDAKRTSTALKKSKRSGVKALSNKELKDLTQRMELERKYEKGLPDDIKKKGKRFTKELLATAGITSAATLIAYLNSDKGKDIRKIFKPEGKHYKGQVKIKEHFGKHGVRVVYK